MSDDFFTRLERQLAAAELRELNRGPALRRFVAARRFVNPRRLLSVPLAAAAAAGVVVVVFAVLGAIDTDEADRRPQPVGTVPAPRMEVVATDVERGLLFGLDGRLLTVQLLPDIPDTAGTVGSATGSASYETVSGAQISATCGTPGDPQGETTLTRRWPADQTSLGYRFPRDVSSWCRLEDQSGSIVASVTFPSVPPGAKEQITETANGWARQFAASAQACNDYYTGTGPTACEPERRPSQKTRQWAAEHRGATVQKIAISGDRAAATLSKDGFEVDTVQLRRTATGEWRIDELGADGAVGSSE